MTPVSERATATHMVTTPADFESRPSREQAEQAVRTLIRWAGDDPAREGLQQTPSRVVRAFEEFFAGYGCDARAVLAPTFSETGAYDDIICLRRIRVQSHCEHHMVPLLGVAHVAYWPGQRVVGISKLARLVDVLARRLQIQEKLTAEIADAIEDVLAPKGVAVVIEARHQCMTTRGIRDPDVVLTTRALRGLFREDLQKQQQVMALLLAQGSSDG